MARTLWNVRKRHEWLQRPLKTKRLKRRTKARSGLLAAEQRRLPERGHEQPAAETADG